MAKVKPPRVIPDSPDNSANPNRAGWRARFMCWLRGHKRGVRVHEPPFQKIVTACPRCGRRRVGKDQQPDLFTTH